MAKAKGKPLGVPNRHLYSRASFLYQAAALFAASTLSAPRRGQPGYDTTTAEGDGADIRRTDSPQLQGMSRRMVTDMRAVSLKMQMRMSPNMKQTICKYCDTLLIEGQSSMSTIENKSKGGRKPWADILVIKCTTCGGEKRYPIDAKRQPRKHHRPLNATIEETKEGEAKPIPDGAEHVPAPS